MNTDNKHILDKITSGDVTMKPRWQFSLRVLLVIAGTLLALFTSVYLLSLVVYILQFNGVGFAPLFGMWGIGLFILRSPWLLIVTTLVFVLVLYVLVSKFSFSYRHPLIYSLFGAVLLVLLGAFAFGQTGSHEQLRQFGNDGGRPVLEALYQKAGRTADGVTPGVIQEVTDDGFVLETAQGESVVVTIDTQTRVRPGEVFKVGDVVFVFGEVNDGAVTAVGVRPAPSRAQQLREQRNNRLLPPQEGAVIRAFPGRK